MSKLTDSLKKAAAQGSYLKACVREFQEDLAASDRHLMNSRVSMARIDMLLEEAQQHAENIENLLNG